MAEVKNAARLEAEQQKRRLDEMENNMVNMQAQMQSFINAQMQAFMNTNKGTWCPCWLTGTQGVNLHCSLVMFDHCFSLSRFLRVIYAVSPSSTAGRLLSRFHQHAPYSTSSSYASAEEATNSSNRNFTSPTKESRGELYWRISPVGDHRDSIVPILDRWIEEGNSVDKYQFVTYIKELCHYGRNYHALEFVCWRNRNFNAFGRISLTTIEQWSVLRKSFGDIDSAITPGDP
ncbi:hypothetical protein LINPERPRIM_LOCUS26542 [Linum perenne]